MKEENKYDWMLWIAIIIMFLIFMGQQNGGYNWQGIKELITEERK